jgi:rRNA maturation endonuclease Nob1
MAGKAKPQGLAKAKATEGYTSRRKATEEGDTEGHLFSTHRDVVSMKRKVAEPDGAMTRRKVTEDADTEGHSLLLHPTIAHELAKARERDVQKDLKQHRFERDARAAKKDQR